MYIYCICIYMLYDISGLYWEGLTSSPPLSPLSKFNLSDGESAGKSGERPRHKKDKRGRSEHCLKYWDIYFDMMDTVRKSIKRTKGEDQNTVSNIEIFTLIWWTLLENQKRGLKGKIRTLSQILRYLLWYDGHC